MIALIVTPEHTSHNVGPRGEIKIQINSKHMTENSVVHIDESCARMKIRIKFEAVRSSSENLIIKITNQHETKKTVVKKCLAATLIYTLTACKTKLDKIEVKYAA